MMSQIATVALWTAAFAVTLTLPCAAMLPAVACMGRTQETGSLPAFAFWTLAFFACIALVLLAGLPGLMWLDHLSGGWFLGGQP